MSKSGAVHGPGSLAFSFFFFVFLFLSLTVHFLVRNSKSFLLNLEGMYESFLLFFIVWESFCNNIKLLLEELAHATVVIQRCTHLHIFILITRFEWIKTDEWGGHNGHVCLKVRVHF